MTLLGDLNITSDGAPLSRIDNLASRTLSKTAGVGSASIAPPVNNSGTVSVTSGTLNLGGSGNHNGIFTAANAGNKIVFAGGTHTFTGGTFTGAGGFKQSAGTLDFDAATAIT
jgi:hypothetical protein